MKDLKWDGKKNTLTDIQKNIISKTFSNSVLIIDEVHNISQNDKKVKKVPPVLESIITHAKNIKLVLLSATPMYDVPREIIFILNLLLLNDGRKPIVASDIFHPNDEIKEEGINKLKKISRGYISYIRSGNPLTNPYRILPKEAKLPEFKYDIFGNPISEKILFTPLILCEMASFQEDSYQQLLRQTLEKNKNMVKMILNNNIVLKNNNNIKGGSYIFKKKIKSKHGGENNRNENNNINENNINLTISINNKNNNYFERNEEGEEEEEEVGKVSILQNITQISNIAYPTLYGFTYGKFGINTEQNKTSGGPLTQYIRKVMVGDEKKVFSYYKYENYSIENIGTKKEVPFLDITRIGNYSTKFKHLVDIVQKSKGVLYIYSQYLDAGIIPIALMLEQNGYSRYNIEGERDLLEYLPNKEGGGGKKPPICYACGLDVKNKIHHDEKSIDYHEFHRAKYLILTSKKDVSKMNSLKASELLQRQTNKYGKDVKIIIGTKVSGEGINFKFIRQVHILDPWFNFSRIEQAIGRAIRHCSHVSLHPEERNVEVFLYVSIPNDKSKDKDTETIDVKNYRLSEKKDKKMKKIRRILKESAIDCPLFYNINVFPTKKEKIKQITSRGETIYVQEGDEPYSVECDYEKDCGYKCAWMPTHVNKNQKVSLNENTYHVLYDKEAIDRYKKLIKKMYRLYKIYTLEDIVVSLKGKNQDDRYLIYKALDSLLNDPKEFLYDIYKQPGKLIYKGIYYIYQPFYWTDKKIPMYYRIRPLSSKLSFITLQSVLSIENENKMMMMMDMDKLFQWDDFIEKLWKNWTNFYYSWKALSFEKKIPIFDQKIIVDIILDRIPYELYKVFLPWLFKKQYILEKVKNVNMYNVPYDLFFLRMKMFFLTYSYLENMGYKDPELKLDKKSLYVGYYDNIGNQVYLWNDNTKRFKHGSTELNNEIYIYFKGILNKFAKIYEQELLSEIYGYMENSQKDIEKLFKIVDKSKDKGAITIEMKKSKRSEITGRICSTFYLGQLNDLFKELKVHVENLKIKKEMYCFLLEWILRNYQKERKNGKLWFRYSVPIENGY